MNYETLTKLPPEAYLNPHNFVTGFDHNRDGAAIEQYFRGRLIALEYPQITAIVICEDGTWGAQGNDWVLTSYEGIGYHANTAALLLGFLDSGLPVYVNRRYEKSKRIK